LKKNLLTYKNHFVPNISADDNCLIINVIHFVIEGVVQDNFFIVARQFCHAGTDRRSYNLVIIVVREVESTIVVVVIHVFIDYNHGAPSVEERVCDDGSKGRAADYEATVDVAAIDAVVEVVGSAMVVNRSDVVRDVHIAVVVVVVRVYVWGVRYSVSVVRTMTIRVTALTGLVPVSSIGIPFCARTAYRLRLCLTLCSVATLGGCVRRYRGACAGVGVGLDVLSRFSGGVPVLSCRRGCSRSGGCRTCCRSGSCRTSCRRGGFVHCRGSCSAIGG